MSVNGASSLWSLAGTLYVGVNGNGTLTIANGGSVTSTGGYLGSASGTNGTVTVTGSMGGVNSTLTLNTADVLYVGDNGNGTLTIANGGHVSSGAGDIGTDFGSTGSVTVDALGGTGSVWNLNGNRLIVGNNDGSGTLTITNGGNVTSNYGEIAFTSGSTGAVTVNGTNSIWTLATSIPASLFVGDAYTGCLTISNGGTVNSGSGYLGNQTSGNGTATVTGANSFWNLNSNSLTVGDSGNGTLTIANGGNVSSSFGDIAAASGSNGTVTVTGANSTWNLALLPLRRRQRQRHLDHRQRRQCLQRHGLYWRQYQRERHGDRDGRELEVDTQRWT